MHSVAERVDSGIVRDTTTSLRRTGRVRAPLSAAQERLWRAEKLGAAGSRYTMALALWLEGALDEVGLQKSLDQLVIRHETLRTRIANADGRGVQVIDAAGVQRLERVDLSDTAAARTREGVRHWVQQEVARPFQVTGGVLFRAFLLRASDHEHVLLLCMHRLICDEWSAEIAVEELSELYSAHVAGRPAVLAELPVQYSDFAVWQRETQREVFRLQSVYWLRQLADLRGTPGLPTDRPRQSSDSLRAGKVEFRCSPQLRSELLKLSRAESSTLLMTLAAIYQVLLMRWSGQQDIPIGIQVPGRRLRELEGLIGLFANNLVLRTPIEPQESFRMLLRRIRQAVLGAYAHQDLPFEELVEELGSERNLALHPVFQVSLSLQSESDPYADWPGLSVSRMAIESSASPLDLSLRLLETREGLRGVIEYALDLFDRDTIERLARAFQLLVQAVVARPDAAVGQLPLLEAGVRETPAAKDLVEVPVAAVSQPAQQYVAPRTPVEQELARIWSEVLQVPRVGVHDNFFELGGGHSLLAMQMVARVREIFAVEIPIGVLFQATDIEKLAARVVAAARSN